VGYQPSTGVFDWFGWSGRCGRGQQVLNSAPSRCTNASVRQRVCVRLALNGATPTHVHGGDPRPVYGHGYPPTASKI